MYVGTDAEKDRHKGDSEHEVTLILRAGKCSKSGTPSTIRLAQDRRYTCTKDMPVTSSNKCKGNNMQTVIGG